MNRDDADHPDLSAEDLALLRHLDDELGPDPYAGRPETKPSVIEVEPLDARVRSAVLGSLFTIALACVLGGLAATSPVLMAIGVGLAIAVRRLARASIAQFDGPPGD
ncbi:MAG: hypothetical protein AAFZ07_17080 [Actinomycetota bacterium]